MSSTIHNPNNTFPFDKLALAKPILTTGGNYFIRCFIDNGPLYIQPPKCNTKSGIVSTGKKIYTDLMFNNMNNDFIQWIETLETTFHNYIHTNKDDWFDGDMELHDIENYFTGILKTYKSGKYYLLRSIIPSSMGKPIIKIYDEAEVPLNMKDIDDTTDIMNILEIKGIKCSVKSFQIEIEIKQMLVIKPNDIFDTFLLKKQLHNNNDNKIQDNPIINEQFDETHSHNEESYIEETQTADEEPLADETQTADEEPLADETPNVDETPLLNEPMSNDKDVLTEDVKLISNINEDNVEKEDLINTLENTTENNSLQEVNVNLEEIPDNELFEIKQRNNVHYEMYKEARKKAKLARDLAISSFLEAKQIKNTYMLENISDSEESDLESDLENNE